VFQRECRLLGRNASCTHPVALTLEDQTDEHET
jgi:hypothetical protein